MLKFNISPVKGRIILKVREITNGECVIDVCARFPDREDEHERTEILEEGDEFGLYEIVATRYTDTDTTPSSN